jgi:hypothetical protein
LLEHPEPQLPKLARAGLAETTVKEHRRALQHLRKGLKPGLPLARALVLYILEQRISKQWRWVTTLKNACMVQGALSLLPMYCAGANEACRVGELVLWRQMMRALAKKSKSEIPNQPKAAVWREVEQVLADKKLKTATRMAILISWFTAQRVGCVVQLAAQDLELRTDCSMTVRFRKGKTVPVRGPYSVHTGRIPQQYMEELQNLLRERAPHQTLLGNTTGVEVKLALRTANTDLEQRSLRRGSLQALSRQVGMTDALLLEYSGHTNINSLLRYLNWGQVAVHRRRTAAAVTGAALVQ